LASPARKPVATLQTPAGLFASPEKRNVVVCLLIAVATLALYNPVNSHPFVNYDDDKYVTENPHVRGGLTANTIAWALTATEAANWHPLTWMSHALDAQIFHLNPAGHHFVSLLIHSLNAVLLFLVLTRLTGRVGPSLLVAALFALHPINVESVAWIAERKNVLSALFFLLTIGAYTWYAKKPAVARYLAVAGLFALGLMAKPMVITLPFVLLLLDYWPLQRMRCASAPSAGTSLATSPISKLVLEKIPLLFLSLASAIITLHAQQVAGAVRSPLQFSLGVRLENAIYAYAMYLWKMIWPAKLAPLYPHPGDLLHGWQFGLALIVLLIISALVFNFRQERYLTVGWLWFLGTLVPVIGLVQVGDQAMADRYAYIPLIGIFIMIAWGTAALAVRWKVGLKWQVISAALVLLVLAATTRQQLSYWESNQKLWTHALAVTDNNFIAHDNLGGALLLAGQVDEAYPHFVAAAHINPRDPMSHANIGSYLQEHGQLGAAVEQYEKTVSLTSDAGLLAGTYANLGAAYFRAGDAAKSRQSYDQALRLNPNQFNAWLGIGMLAEQQAKWEEAITNLSRSVEIRPTDAAYVELARAFSQSGRTRDALSAYQAALQLNPDNAEAQRGAQALTGH
jgi:protein O-mannosyl-transferase